jgi:EAL domain-containing protein (putative c-di-GMP-specific phosphodiesterase class I)
MTACRDAASWPVAPGKPAVGVSVNVSARQVEQPSFVEEVCTMITASGLDPRRLTLELTETSAIADLDQAAGRLQQLRNLGMGIALDDYGTGYSTLAMLRRLPLTVVKIDQWFVGQLGDGDVDTTLVGLVVETAHHLGLTVCAEGIENPDQVARLAAMGCDIGQGWHYARPLPGSEAFTAWLGTSR